MSDIERCPHRSPGGVDLDGRLPRKGTRCGLWAGHDGPHTVLIPTGYPWSDSRKRAGRSELRHTALGKRPMEIPPIFSGVAIEVYQDGRVSGRWFIGRNHAIARRLLKDLGIVALKKSRLPMAKARRRATNGSEGTPPTEGRRDDNA